MTAIKLYKPHLYALVYELVRQELAALVPSKVTPDKSTLNVRLNVNSPFRKFLRQLAKNSHFVGGFLRYPYVVVLALQRLLGATNKETLSEAYHSSDTSLRIQSCCPSLHNLITSPGDLVINIWFSAVLSSVTVIFSLTQLFLQVSH